MTRKKKAEYRFLFSMGMYRKCEKGINDGNPFCGKATEESDAKLEYLQKEAAVGIDSRNNPTAEQYVEKRIQLHGQYIRTQTANKYECLSRRFIISTIGQLKMKDVLAVDILEAQLSAANISRSVYNKVVMILKIVFDAAAGSNIITDPLTPSTARAERHQTPRGLHILPDAAKGTVTEVLANLAGHKNSKIVIDI